MPRSILVTEGSSPLGVVLVRLFAARGYAVAAACDRGAGEAESSGDHLLSLPWNRRSAASARTVLLSAVNAFGTLDEAVILEPPFTAAASAFASAASADVDRAFDDAKGPVLIAREVIASFLGRGAGIVSFVSGGPASGPVEAAVKDAFRGLATSLMSSPGGAGIIANGFQGGLVDAGEYAAFIDRTLEEKARKISGRWFSLPGRGGFLQGVFKTSSSP
jgi:NAD(P)-dependent dehydrogenase (short-subunit alcohol dehydrogenase family)